MNTELANNLQYIFLDICALKCWAEDRNISTPIIYCPAKSMAIESKREALMKLQNIIEEAQKLILTLEESK